MITVSLLLCTYIKWYRKSFRFNDEILIRSVFLILYEEELWCTNKYLLNLKRSKKRILWILEGRGATVTNCGTFLGAAFYWLLPSVPRRIVENVTKITSGCSSTKQKLPVRESWITQIPPLNNDYTTSHTGSLWLDLKISKTICQYLLPACWQQHSQRIGNGWVSRFQFTIVPAAPVHTWIAQCNQIPLEEQ